MTAREFVASGASNASTESTFPWFKMVAWECGLMLIGLMVHSILADILDFNEVACAVPQRAAAHALDMACIYSLMFSWACKHHSQSLGVMDHCFNSSLMVGQNKACHELVCVLAVKTPCNACSLSICTPWAGL